MAEKDDETIVEEVVEEPKEPEAPQEGEEPVLEPEKEEEPKQEEEPKEPEEERSAKARPDGTKPSRRESLRIQQLLAQNAELRKKMPDNLKRLDYGKELEADDETRVKLETDRREYAEQAYNSGLERANSIQFHTRLEVDAPRVEGKYPQLNRESDKFNPAVADAINQMYLSAVGFDTKADTVQNPNLRYADYVGAFMELVEAAAGEKVSRTQSNIVKQVANTALRPNGGTAKRLNLNQDPQNMSDEELKAYGKQLGMRV